MFLRPYRDAKKKDNKRLEKLEKMVKNIQMNNKLKNIDPKLTRSELAISVLEYFISPIPLMPLLSKIITTRQYKKVKIALEYLFNEVDNIHSILENTKSHNIVERFMQSINQSIFEEKIEYVSNIVINALNNEDYTNPKYFVILDIIDQMNILDFKHLKFYYIIQKLRSIDISSPPIGSQEFEDFYNKPNKELEIYFKSKKTSEKKLKDYYESNNIFFQSYSDLFSYSEIPSQFNENISEEIKSISNNSSLKLLRLGLIYEGDNYKLAYKESGKYLKQLYDVSHIGMMILEYIGLLEPK